MSDSQTTRVVTTKASMYDGLAKIADTYSDDPSLVEELSSLLREMHLVKIHRRIDVEAQVL